MRSGVSIAVVVVLFASFAQPSSAHTYHASLAEVDYNAKSKVLELGIRVFANDLEEALTRRRGRKVRLDVTPDVGTLTADYLRDTIVIADREGRAVPLQWIGMELRVDEAWLYVQGAAPAGIDGGTVTARVFFDLFDDQVNTVNIQQGDARTTLVFKPGDSAQKVAFGG